MFNYMYCSYPGHFVPEANLQGSICVKRLTKLSDEHKQIEGASAGQKLSTSKRRALFNASESEIAVSAD